VGLYFHLHSRNITSAGVTTFLRDLLRHLRGPVVLLWDGGKIHGGPAVAAFCRQHPRLRVHRLPSYAPELNPDEFVWTKAKDALANSDHPAITPLASHLWRALRRLQRSQPLLWSCIEASDLPWP
jgi:transposase